MAKLLQWEHNTVMRLQLGMQLNTVEPRIFVGGYSLFVDCNMAKQVPSFGGLKILLRVYIITIQSPKNVTQSQINQLPC